MRYYVFVFTLLLCFACVGLKKAKEETPIRKQIVLKEGGNAQASALPYAVQQAEVRGDSLYLSISYAGGCGKEEIDLVWNGTAMKSMPPQMNVWLQIDQSTACETVALKQLVFDLAPLTKGHEKAIIRLKNYPDRIVYNKK